MANDTSLPEEEMGWPIFRGKPAPRLSYQYVKYMEATYSVTDAGDDSAFRSCCTWMPKTVHVELLMPCTLLP